MSEATIASVEQALREAGWAGCRLQVRGGVVTAPALAPSPDNLERLVSAWRFDASSQGWGADSRPG